MRRIRWLFGTAPGLLLVVGEGTLEVVQDVTHIRALEGERRLLDEGE